MKKLFIQFIIITLTISSNVAAQVTIGSSSPPASGALLDLKENDDPTGGATARKGLALPRVELQNTNALTMGNNIIPDGPTKSGTSTVWKDHTGLVVFNIGENPPFCKGLYVWNSEKWNRIMSEPCISMDISPSDPLYFLSGQNGSSIVAKTLQATWYRPSATVSLTSVAKAPYSAVDLTAANAIDPQVSTWTTPPQAFSIIPAAMSQSEVDANPFLTKESELTFTASENGKAISYVLAVNQTNKAITINSSMKPLIIENPIATSGQNTLQSNAKWKLTNIEPNDATNVFSNIQLDGNPLTVGGIIDWEQSNNVGQGVPNNLTYTISAGSLKARYNTLTFSDAESPKRFSDITLSIYQCNDPYAPTPKMNEWANAAGFPNVPTVRVSLADDEAKGIDTPNPTTGIAWHRDQDGNIFLSASFDTTSPTSDSQRWMITNLSAKTYASNVSHTQGLSPTGPSANGAQSYTQPYWCYAGGDFGGTSSTVYNNNPRIGLLYTWNAATAGRGGASGTETINDAATPPTVGNRIQGICPNGWHLPSDYEWTVLENLIAYRTSLYSELPDISPDNPNLIPQTTSGAGIRGGVLGNAMKEWCEPYSAPAYKGVSNPIFSTTRPGFNGLLGGYGYRGNVILYSQLSAFWTASGQEDKSAWSRGFYNNSSGVEKRANERIDLFSVRCKKD